MEILLADSSDRQAGRLLDAWARFLRRNPELTELNRPRLLLHPSYVRPPRTRLVLESQCGPNSRSAHSGQ
jgi:hypothetical protein